MRQNASRNRRRAARLTAATQSARGPLCRLSPDGPSGGHHSTPSIRPAGLSSAAAAGRVKPNPLRTFTHHGGAYRRG